MKGTSWVVDNQSWCGYLFDTLWTGSLEAKLMRFVCPSLTLALLALLWHRIVLREIHFLDCSRILQ